MITHADRLLAQLRDGKREALEAMGAAAAAMTQAQMQTGYGRPIQRTGALMRDVRWQTDGDSVRVGNTLPYAPVIHQGTARTPARPYLADALAGGAETLAQEAGRAIAVRIAAE